MKTYIEIKVPIRYEEPWFVNLRDMMKDIPVKWQQGFYHITIAFVDDTPLRVDLRPIFDKHFREKILQKYLLIKSMLLKQLQVWTLSVLELLIYLRISKQQ